ncbi:septum site-determining protein Ssd [Actinopolyspora mortivallis]|uniref:septum site-determining protein Ssd n=1 Tax=Actinopolyspora mortivallis TaxID=33906 RepID=UPI00215994F8|nr:septum site-determining protein Ssd [Actinopolyspora mortivallis]
MAVPEPLVVTADAELAGELSRIAAAAGCAPRRFSPGEDAKPWATAPVVLLDTSAAERCAAVGLPRRKGLVLVERSPDPSFWREAFHRGAEQAFDLSSEEPRLLEMLAGLTEGGALRSGEVLAVLGGCGGAGASVLSALTGVLAARSGRRCLLLDCDPLGGGLDFALGQERTAGIRWADLSVGTSRPTAASLREAAPTRWFGSGALSVLCPTGRNGQGELSTPAVEAVVEAGSRAGDLVVCDLPRPPDEPARALLDRADLVVLVVPAEVRACTAARRLLRTLEGRDTPVRAVVRGPAPGGLRVADVRDVLGVEVLAAVRADPRLARLVDRFGLHGGGTRGPSVRAARKVLDALCGTSRVV